MASAATRAALVVALLGVAVNLCVAARSRTPPGTSKAKYNLVFIGDSLTDTGNDLKVAGVPDPKIYYKGRFSNGPIWVDQLRKSVAKNATVQVHNYAYGGGSACANPGVQAYFPFIKDMTAQIATFASDVQNKKVRLNTGKTLVFQWSGSDDFLHYIYDILATNTTISTAALAAVANSTVACRVQGAAALAAVPGVTDIVIVPLAPVYIAPAVPEAMKQPLRAAETAAANLTIQAMAALGAELEAAGSAVKIHVLGETQWIANGANKVTPPFTVFNQPCFWNTGSPLVITPGIKLCKNPEEHLFFDQTHPTTRFHEWFANKGVMPRLQTLGLLP